MKIKIKEPCDADWNKMKIGMKSRHCELCVKSVMDFTKMSREEILLYLFNNNSKSTCARMYGNQMDFHFQELEAIIEGTRKQSGNRSFLVLSFATLALMSCNTDPVMGEICPPPSSEITQQLDSLNNHKQDSIAKLNDSIKLGKMIKKDVTPPPCPPKLGEVDFITGELIEVETGDIELVMPEPPVLGGIGGANQLKGGTTVLSIEEITYEIAEKMPEFVGGVDSLMSFLSNHIKYPTKAQKAGKEGRVFVQFIVEIDGSISHSKVLKGFEENCDKEALRVISSMPKWIPGENNGNKVRVKYTLPVKFVLN